MKAGFKLSERLRALAQAQFDREELEVRIERLEQELEGANEEIDRLKEELRKRPTR